MTLPECVARHVDVAAGTMYCRHPRVHAPGCQIVAEVCGLCTVRCRPTPLTLRSLDEVLRAAVRQTRCTYLGPQIGERACPTCNVRVRLKVFACQHPAHTETTWRDCAACPDHQPV